MARLTTRLPSMAALACRALLGLVVAFADVLLAPLKALARGSKSQQPRTQEEDDWLLPLAPPRIFSRAAHLKAELQLLRRKYCSVANGQLRAQDEARQVHRANATLQARPVPSIHKYSLLACVLLPKVACACHHWHLTDSSCGVRCGTGCGPGTIRCRAVGTCMHAVMYVQVQMTGRAACTCTAPSLS